MQVGVEAGTGPKRERSQAFKDEQASTQKSRRSLDGKEGVDKAPPELAAKCLQDKDAFAQWHANWSKAGNWTAATTYQRHEDEDAELLFYCKYGHVCIKCSA